MTTSDPLRQGASTGTGGTAGQAAAEVAGRATQAAGDVASTAAQQAGMVAREATDQAQRLLSQAQQELNEQAGQQARRLAENLHRVAAQLSQMASNVEQGTPAQTIVSRLAQTSDRVAGYVDRKRPGDMLDDLQDFARRRPGVFLMGAAAAGFALGRLGNAARKASSDREDTAALSATAGARPLPGMQEPEGVIDLTSGARTVEPTVEALASQGRDPYATGEQR